VVSATAAAAGCDGAVEAAWDELARPVPAPPPSADVTTASPRSTHGAVVTSNETARSVGADSLPGTASVAAAVSDGAPPSAGESPTASLVTDGLVVVLGGADADVAGRGVAEALPVAVLPGAVQAGPVLRVASVGVVPVAVVPVAVVPVAVVPVAVVPAGAVPADVAGQRGPAGDEVPVGGVQAGPVLRVASVGVVPVGAVPADVVPADVVPAAAGQLGRAGDEVPVGAAGDCAVPGPPPCGRWPGSPGSAGV
jgi:hypothetical protein